MSSQLSWGFKVQVGSFFEIDKVAYREGRLVLPTTHRKYHNVRVLDQETFKWLSSCKEQKICHQSISEMSVEVEKISSVKSRSGMWVADVSFARKWLITFLLFKNEKGYTLQVPKVIKFLDSRLQAQVLSALETELEKER